MKRVLVLLLMIATYLALDGGALRAANDPRAAQLTYESWTKFCFDDSNCVVGTGTRGACFPSGGGLAINMTGGKDASLSAYFSTKRLIEGAISVQVDQGDPILIAHPKCDGLICAGRVQIDDEVVERLKHSKMITIEATDTAHQKNSLSFSLADFAKTYDGPSAPLPNVVEETQENLKKELAKREEEQKKLQCQE